MYSRRSNRNIVQNARHRLPERQRQHLGRIDRHHDGVSRLDPCAAAAEPMEAAAGGDHAAVGVHDVDSLLIRLGGEAAAFVDVVHP